MSRVLRSVRKRKKGCTLGAVDVIDRERYAELEVDAMVELIRSLVPLGLLHIEELLDEEVTALAGGCFRHQLLLPNPYLVLTKPLRLDIQCQRAASVKIGWKYLDD